MRIIRLTIVAGRRCSIMRFDILLLAVTSVMQRVDKRQPLAADCGGAEVVRATAASRGKGGTEVRIGQHVAYGSGECGVVIMRDKGGAQHSGVFGCGRVRPAVAR